MMSEEELPLIWQKIKILSGLAASILVPLVIGIIGHGINRSIQANEIGLHYVELAVEILKEPPKSETENLRRWAVSIVNNYSRVSLTEAAKKELENEVLSSLDVISIFEGGKLTANGKFFPYLDQIGIEAIGYGYYIKPEERKSGIININGQLVRYAEGITKQQARALLEKELEPIRQEIQNLVTVELSKNQLDALTSFVHHLGLGALAKSTLLKKLNAGRYDEVPDEMRRWTKKAGGQELEGLVRRREAEIELWNRKD